MPYQGTTPVSPQIGVLQAGFTPVQVQLFGVSTAGTTSYPLVPVQPANYQALIASLAISASAAGITVQLQSSTTTGIVSGTFTTAANSTVVLPENPLGWFQSNVGEGINVVTNTTSAVFLTGNWASYYRDGQ